MRMAIGVAVFFAIGCGGGGGNGGDDAPPMIDAPGSQPDAPPLPEGYTRLVGRTWSLPGGATDTYRCARFTIAAETYITSIMAQAPVGTHHTVLSISDGSTQGPDGEYNCDVGELGMVMLYASGVGTSPLDFPSGVGVRVPAGTQLHLNLHLFNATDAMVTGDSAILVKSQPTPTATLAEMVFAGTTAIYLPPNTQQQSVNGGCTEMTAPYTLFAVWPHMHQIAKHQKVELIRGGNTQVLHDLPFDFAEQNYYMKDPVVQVQLNDRIRITCSYLNNTGTTVTIGDGSNQEMCFSGFYRYPARNAGLFECSSGPGI